jgi:predicted transcriptional regulator
VSVGEYCNRDVIVTTKATSIIEVARLMRHYHVGDLVITTSDSNKHTPIGIITDRDIVVELVAKELDLATLTVGDVMSHEIHIASEQDSLLDTVKSMRNKGVRRIPVIDSMENLVGIFSLDDAIDVIAEQLQDLAGLIQHEQRREHKIRAN